VNIQNDVNKNYTLTVIVPAYNSASTLEKCLDSLCNENLQNEVEVLIVNDGSTDDTKSIALKYEEKYPNFRLISKDNGGHGSTINIASKLANGRYMKVIDSDDWVVNLCEFVKILRNTTVDIVFTNFFTVDLSGNNIREYRMHSLQFGHVYSFHDFWTKKKYVQEVCNFHGITYRTDFYNAANIHLSEKISYEDQEYTTLPFANVKSVLPLDLHLYRYRIGDPNQSMSAERQVKQINQMETVLCKVIELTPTSISPIVVDYFIFKKSAMVLSYYMAALIKNPYKKDGRKLAKNINKIIKTKDPVLYATTRKVYSVCYVLSYFGIADTLKQRFQHFDLYKKLVRYAS